MDPVTHSLLGAAAARSRLGEGKPAAMFTLVVAANLPDVDVLSYALGSDFALGFRRGLTHGPIGLAVLPAVLTLIVLGWYRLRGLPRPRLRWILPLAYIGSLSHPLLDWLNTYGVRLMMPFDHRWFYGDALFIVDPWMWLCLGGAVYLGRSRGKRARRLWLLLAAASTAMVLLASPVLWGKVLWLLLVGAVAWLGWRQGTPPSRRSRLLAGWALVLFLLYAAMLAVSGLAASRRLAGQLEAEGVVPRRIMVGPVPVTPFSRDLVIETTFGYRVGRLQLLPWKFELEEDVWPRLQLAGAVERAWKDPCIAGFVRWTRFPVAEVERTTRGSDSVRLYDLRYARRPTVSFAGVEVEVDDGAEEQRSEEP